jgi:tRNA-dihydrouridine synthase B
VPSFLQPLQLKNLKLPVNVIYSPLAGVSDYPFRKMVRHHMPGLIYCEMVKMDALVRFDSSTFHLLDYDPSMHPIGAQLCGSRVEYAAPSAKIIEDLGFDIVDLNCGCPVDKVTKDGSGSALLKDPKRIGEILHEMVSAVSIPVTVKIRCGWDETSINAAEITRIAEEAGACAIAIHGRTRVQGYKGPADWSSIYECKRVAKTIKVIGNGDIFSPQAAEAIFTQTGCDGVLLSRGTMGKPWLGREVLNYFNEHPLPYYDECEALKQHFSHILAYQPIRKALLDLRRISCWYIKKNINTREIRSRLCKVATIEEAIEIIDEWSRLKKE